MNIEMTPARREKLKSKYQEVFDKPLWQRILPYFVNAAVFGYFIFAIFFFNLPGVIAGAKWERAGLYMADWVSWQAQPKFRFKDGQIELQYPRFSPLGENPNPDWISETPDGHRVAFGSENRAVEVTNGLVRVWQNGETYDVFITEDAALMPANAPASFEERNGRVRVDFGFDGNVEIRNTQVRIWRRFWGWENFFFDPASPFWGKNLFEVTSLIVAGPQIAPDQSNLSLAIDNFLHNAEWQHLDVFTKLLQTIVMAFVGTLFAAVLAFPLSFIAARNITMSKPSNWFMKRFFDFLRSVDMLIWALFFTRSFGPGPLAGISAIFFTDTGTLGKLYSEALENVDDKQREGVKSVGAAPAEVQRYGVVPQVLPLFASQALYFWESNTRSATIIGAVGAGGIGLKLLEAMRTGTDWENVGYMVILILIVVFVFDNISNHLRSKLIGKDAH
jgi:phosphonate transport system permease protein